MKHKLNLFITNPANFAKGHYDYCFALSHNDYVDGWIRANTLDIEIPDGLVEQCINVSIEEVEKKISERYAKINELVSAREELMSLEHKDN